MQIERITNPNQQLTLVIKGDMDAHGCSDLQPVLEELVNTPEPMDVTLDMDQVNFLDSSGIGAIVYLFKRLKASEHSLDLNMVHGQPMEIIKLLRIDKAITVNDRGDAGEGLSNEANGNIAVDGAYAGMTIDASLKAKW